MFSQGAFANPLPAGCDLGEQPSLPLTFTDDLRPVGHATINGAAVPVMLSTGAAESLVLNRKTLDRLGIAVRTSTSKMSADDGERNPLGVDIVRDISHALLQEFSFGAAKVNNATYMVEDFMDDTFGARIGAGTLLQTDLEIALDAGYIKPFKPNGCFRAHLAYWDPQAVSVLAWHDPWKREPRFVFSVRIAGKDLRALLSTATPYSYLPRATAERLGLTPGSPGATREAPVPGHDADKPVWKVPVPAMSIGALEVKELDLRVIDLPHSGELLVLGADFLHRHRIYIATSQKQIYFSPIASPRILKRGSVEVIPQIID
ncbi:aspartyl protease family protein [Massilia consociata]|uniref:aspartyl protease family protein n=1 Tax=Massilia consociata TaxID=760117 RepID=UPI0036D37233